MIIQIRVEPEDKEAVKRRMHVLCIDTIQEAGYKALMQWAEPKGDGESVAYPEADQKFHDMLQFIFETGDPARAEWLKGNIQSFYDLAKLYADGKIKKIKPR
jgi:hypothetical protein